MAVARRQHKVTATAGAYLNAQSAAFTSNVLAGSTLVALISGGTANGIASVTDNNGNTWQMLEQNFNDINTAIFVAKNVNAGATTVYTATDGGYYLMSLTVLEITGADAVAPIAQHPNSSTEAYLNAWNIALTVAANAYILAFLGTSNVGDYTGSYSTGNVVDADAPDYTGAVSGDKTVTAAGSTTVGFDLAGYNRGTLYALEFSPVASAPSQTITQTTIGDQSSIGSPTLTLGAAPAQTITGGTVAAPSPAVGSHAVSLGVPPVQTITGGTVADVAAVGSPTLTAPLPSLTISAQTIGDESVVGTGGQVFAEGAVLKVETALDLFDSFIDPVMWAQFGDDVSIEGQALKIYKAAGNNYLGLRSQRVYSLYNSFAYMQLIDGGDLSQPTWEVTPLMLSNEGDTSRVYITIGNRSIIAWLLVAGDYQVQSITPFDKNKHKWFRIRESNGTLYWETSNGVVANDGQLVWQNLAALTTPSPYYFDLSELHVQIQAGDYTPSSPANTAYIDNLNPPITLDQTIITSTIDAPVLSQQLETAVFDPNDPTIYARSIADANSVGVPTVEQDIIVYVPSLNDFSVVGTPSVNGALASGDTAPSYQYFRRAFLPIRDINAGIAISFERGYSANARFFIVGTSAMNSGDVFQGNGSTIQEFDKFNYGDYSQYINTVQYHQEQDVVGSMVMGYADIELQNRGDLFSPYGTSPIANLILPNRPLKIYAGFQKENMQLFVGQTERLPEVTKTTATFHAKDFIKSFADNSVIGGRVYVNKRTDQIIDDILQNDAGLSPVQYTLDVGTNTIGFMYIEPDTKIGDVLRKLCEAEQGRLYQDNLGRMIFKNRVNKRRNTPLRILQEMVLSEKEPDAQNVRNRVTIESDVRAVLSTRQVFPNLQDGQVDAYDDFQSIEVAAGASVEKFFNMKDPVTSYTMPSGSNYTANSKNDGSGTNMTNQVTVTVLAQFTDSVKVRFTNSNTTTKAYVTKYLIQGTPAPIVDQIRIDVSDEASIGKYGEQLLEIKNNYFTDATYAQNAAQQIVNNLKEATLTREITMRGIPYMAVGDVVTYYDGQPYVVDVIKGQISASAGNRQDVRLRRV